MKRHSIRRTFAVTYSIVIIAAFILVTTLYMSIQIPQLQEQAFASLQQNTSSISAAMDTELNQMRTTGLNIAYSSLVQSQLFNTDENINDYGTSSQASTLSTLLATLIFPNSAIDQVNLYTNNGIQVSSGLQNSINTTSAQSQPWFQTIQTADHHQTMQFIGMDDSLSKFSTDVYSKHFVSYVLQNYNVFNAPTGYIEVKQRLDRIVASAISYSSVYGEQVYIFTVDGTMMFPVTQETPAELFKFVKSQNFPQAITTFGAEDHQEYLICAPSNYGDFYTVMVIDQALLYRPIWEQMASVFIVTLIALAFTLSMGLVVARRLSAPIGEISRQCADFDFSNLKELPPLDTKIAELYSLHSAFVQMHANLTESVSNQMMLQTQEMQSRMLALQSQMNPHFLFNSLAAIQAMSDENMNREIAVMCQSMSNILRYISSDSEPEVPLYQELAHTQDYLICMVIRYQGDLEYHLNIPEEMKSIKVPKLCIQLLVENAIKFTTTKRPPWSIDINGVCDENGYEIQIKDNGPGFTEESIATIYSRLEDIKKTNLLPSLEINGMGLLNIFIRYRLLHGDGIVFRPENNPEGGASITIGEVYHGTEI